MMINFALVVGWVGCIFYFYCFLHEVGRRRKAEKQWQLWEKRAEIQHKEIFRLTTARAKRRKDWDID